MPCKRHAEDALAVVHAFCAAWAEGNVDCIVGMLAPDVEWENVPIGVLRGREAARERIAAAFARARSIEWRLRATAVADDGLVMTERLDVLALAGGDVHLPVMGVFRVGADGITLWRDYFDGGLYARDRARCEAAA